MAKFSKKPTKTPIKTEHLNRFLFDCMDEGESFFRPEPITHMPALDMFATREELVIKVELPGVRREDIDLTMSRDKLIVKSVKFECFEEDKINYVCMERSFGRLFRAIDLPYPVDSARARAVFRNGILRVILPRVQDKRSATKKVPVESI